MSSLVSPPDAAPILAQEFRVDKTCTLVLDVPGARTQIRRRPESGRVSINVTVASEETDAELLTEQLQINTHQEVNTVCVTGRSDQNDLAWWRWRRASAAELHIAVRVPSRTNLNVRVPGGALDIADLQGELTVNAFGAAVYGRDLSGSLSLNTRSSDVTIDGFKGTALNLDAAAGGASISDVAADTLSLRGSSTNLSVQNSRGALSICCTAAPITVTDHSGPCTGKVYGSKLTFEGAVDDETILQTIGAPLTARLPTSSDADIEAHGEPAVLDETLAFEGKRSPTEIEGTLSSGGPALRLRALQGAVRCEPA